MTRHPGSVEFKKIPDPIDEKVEQQKAPDPMLEPVEGIGMEKQEEPQLEDEMAGAPKKDEAA